MPLADLQLVRAHEQTCRAEFALLDAVKHRRQEDQSRDVLSNTLGAIGEAIRHQEASLAILKTERDQLARQLQTSHESNRPRT